MRSVQLSVILLLACADGTAPPPPTESLAQQDAAVALASELTPATLFSVVLRA